MFDCQRVLGTYGEMKSGIGTKEFHVGIESVVVQWSLPYLTNNYMSNGSVLKWGIHPNLQLVM
jgi:hypothetical protein